MLVTLTRPFDSSLVTIPMVILPSVTRNCPHSRANAKIESLVIPGNIKPFRFGVISSRSEMKQIL